MTSGRSVGDERDGVPERAALRVFINYRRDDSAVAVNSLWKKLVESGFERDNIFRDIEAVKPGADFTQAIGRSLESCDVVLAVVGRHWLDVEDDGRRRIDTPDDWVRRELEVALAGGVDLIPVLVDRASMPAEGELPESLGEFARRMAMAITPESEDDDTEKLIGMLDERARKVASKRIESLRDQNPDFTGRDKLLAEIHSSLQNRGDGPAIVAVVGFPGFGKTQLAVEYAYRHRHDYRVVWEIPAEKATTRLERFAALSREFRLPVHDDHEAVEAVRERLERSDDWLLIFDNADPEDDLKAVLPRRGGGHVIVTSLRHRVDIPRATTIEIEGMTPAEATTFLMKLLPGDDAAGAEELAQELQGYPLALEQAAAFIRTNRTSTANYIEILRESAAKVWGRSRDAPTTYENTVMGTWGLVFDEVERRAEAEAPGAVELLNLCAFLDPDGIRLDLLSGHVEALPDTLAAVLRDRLARTDAVGLLAGYSHVRWTDDGDGITMHRIAQRLTRERLGDEQLQWADTAVRLVLAAFPDDPSDIRNKAACTELLPHANAALEHAEVLGGDAVGRAKLLDRVGVYLHARAQFAAAKDALERSFNLFVEAQGFEAADTATVENHLGSLMRELGDYESAQKHHLSARKTHAISGESIDVARDNAALGSTLVDRGDLPAAKRAFEDALGAFGEASVDTYRAVADCHSGLFAVLLRSGNFVGAKRHLERTVAVYDEFQRDHPEAAFFRYVHDRLFGAKVGEVPLEEVIKLAEDVYGPKHPEVAEWTRWLADDLLSRGEIDAAATTYDRALALDRAAYGENHIKVGRDLFNTFAVLAVKDEADAARESLARATAIFERAAVPDIAFARFEEALGSLGVIRAAVAEMARIWEITREVCGDTSPLTASALAHLAAELKEADNMLDRAESFAIAALDGMAMHFGANDPHVARCFGLLGSIQFRRNDIEGARRSYENACAILDAAEHPNQHELAKVLTGLYPVLAVSDDRRAVHAAAPAPAKGGSDLEAAAQRAKSITPEAPAVLERAITVAEEVAAVMPLIELCDEVLHPAARFGEEESILRSVLRLAEDTYGPKHPAVLGILARLGRVHVERMEFEQAHEFFDRALAIDDGEDAWSWPLEAAAGLRARGDFEAAREWHTQLLAAAERRPGTDPPIVASALIALGGAHLANEDAAEALTCFERALSIHIAEHGAEDVSVATDHVLRLSPTLAALGDVAAAGDHLEQGLAIYSRQPDVSPDDVTTVRVSRWLTLGDIAAGRGDTDAARHFFEAGHQRVGETAPPAAVAEFHARVGAVAATSGDREEAIDRFETSAGLWVEAGGNDPFWAVVRMASPAVPRGIDGRTLHDALRVVREEVGMEVKTFRPKIRAAVPGDWFEKESITLLSPDGQANVIASSEPLDETIDLQQYAEVQGDLLQREFPGYREFSFEETELFGGRQGYLRHFEWSPPDGVPVTQVQVYYVDDGRGYTATATTPSSNFSTVETELRQILSGLKLIS